MFKSNKNLIILGLGLLTILSFGLLSAPSEAKAQVYSDGYAHLDIHTNPNPALTALFPASNNSGNITITGFGFIPASIVKVNGSDHPAKFIDSRHLIVNLTMNELTASDPLYISVFNGAPGGGYSNALSIKVDQVYTNYNGANNNTANYNNSSNYNNSTNNSNSTYSYNRNQGNGSNSNYQNGNGSNGGNSGSQNNTLGSLASSVFLGSSSSGLSLAPSGLIGWVLFAIVIMLIIIVVRRLFGFTDTYHSTPLKHD